MISTKATLVISITLILVVLLNIAIFYGAKRRKPTNSYQMFGKIAKRARNPWEVDKAKLDELSRQVAELREAERCDQEQDNG